MNTCRFPWGIQNENSQIEMWHMSVQVTKGTSTKL